MRSMQSNGTWNGENLSNKTFQFSVADLQESKKVNKNVKEYIADKDLQFFYFYCSISNFYFPNYFNFVVGANFIAGHGNI